MPRIIVIFTAHFCSTELMIGKGHQNKTKAKDLPVIQEVIGGIDGESVVTPGPPDFISALTEVLHSLRKGPRIVGNGLEILGVEYRASGMIDPVSAGTSTQYTFADIWLLGLWAANKVFGAEFDANCQKTDKVRIVQKLGLRPITSNDKDYGPKTMPKELMGKNKLGNFEDDGLSLGKRSIKTQNTLKSSKPTVVDEIVIATSESRDKKESKRELTPIKAKAGQIPKRGAAEVPAGRAHGKLNQQKERLNHQTLGSKESSSSCRPSPVAKSKPTAPPPEAFDLPIILVPGLHSRGELVLENFVQMFAHGKYVLKSRFRTGQTSPPRKVATKHRRSMSCRAVEATDEQTCSKVLSYEYRNRKLCFLVTDDVNELMKRRITYSDGCDSDRRWFAGSSTETPFCRRTSSSTSKKAALPSCSTAVGFLQPVRGYFFKTKDVPVPEEYKKWNVRVLEVPRESRHKDVMVQASFWEDFSSFLIRRFN